MSRRLRAVARLASAIAHALHGTALALWRLPGLGEAQRHERIQWWACELLRKLGIAVRVDGVPPPPGTLVVANHVSWLDIMAIHAVVPQARFVSKADVRRWPVLSKLIDGAGTLYLERERKRDALRVVHLMAEALKDGQVVAVFPEGTTTDGRAMLPFHANLLQAAIATGRPIQPVALRFSDAHDPISRAVEYIGDTTLAQSLWTIACGESVSVRVCLLAPVESAGAERRALAAGLQARIEAALGAMG